LPEGLHRLISRGRFATPLSAFVLQLSLRRNIGLLREFQLNGAQEEFAGCEHQSPQTQGDQPAQVALDRIQQVLPRDAAGMAALEEEDEEEMIRRAMLRHPARRARKTASVPR
jgi:hypothetical protein